jgi:hypothetical protein
MRGEDDPPTDDGGRNRQADFRGQSRSNETHASTTDPDAIAKDPARRPSSASWGTP